MAPKPNEVYNQTIFLILFCLQGWQSNSGSRKLGSINWATILTQPSAGKMTAFNKNKFEPMQMCLQHFCKLLKIPGDLL